MNENDRIAAELKELEYNIAHLENEKQKGWLSTSKQNQLAEDRARRDEIMARVATDVVTVIGMCSAGGSRAVGNKNRAPS
ncbi:MULTISPECIES: hypothetical protein [Neorhizobium]|jgi:hypothetical protein|uniref:hypothetical protein n=1 Tax=Neorhizobium sp. T6_25 TaxID=2093833 RepID=UPI000CFA1DA3|nr:MULTISPECIES: hypothetical protein [Neorhizobium]